MNYDVQYELSEMVPGSCEQPVEPKIKFKLRKGTLTCKILVPILFSDSNETVKAKGEAAVAKAKAWIPD